ncbi:hypothetical protein DM860_006959 [Cuscuta australis]|uniref:Glycosyltransferase n=1 Tax=Cuscuta australis TaxID=267555 RepID=A0A328E5U8_9ASTE|nr:hypothetical protein DM860_006959 [Cuscuta australis]
MKEAVELVFIPVPLMGHLISAVEMAKLITGRRELITITILVLEQPHHHHRDPRITSYVRSQTKRSPRLNFATLTPASDSSAASDPPAKVPNEGFRPQVRDWVAGHGVGGSGRKLGGIIVDLFSTAMVDVADEFGVPAYVFFTSGAATIGLFLYLKGLRMDNDDVDDVLRGLSSSSSLAIPSYANPKGTIREVCREQIITRTRGVMINTFSDLESHAVKALRDNDLMNFPPFYPVGPVLNLEKGEEEGEGEGEGEKKKKILEWLDEREHDSVVFLCFGSNGYFCEEEEEQVKEIATGLERSGHRFLWALRHKREESDDDQNNQETNSTKGRSMLPEGFTERTRERGMVIGWAPQVAILGHPAVGGFVSHCGSNSTLESVWFGKPLATWPMYAEQEANAFQIVKEMGVGVEMRMDCKKAKDINGGKAQVVGAEVIEEKVKELMDPMSPIKLKAKEMSEMSRGALVEGGSSYASLLRFLDDVITNLSS